MKELDQFSNSIADKKLIVFVGIGAFCAGILIGFKLAGGQKVELDQTPIQLIPEPIKEPQETEAEND